MEQDFFKIELFYSILEAIYNFNIYKDVYVCILGLAIGDIGMFAILLGRAIKKIVE